jgi:hypothetical protein
VKTPIPATFQTHFAAFAPLQGWTPKGAKEAKGAKGAKGAKIA